MFDLEMLRVIWWILLGVLFIGFAITDGFDFGAAALLPLVARNDEERDIVLNTFGPVWEGNQVWIILGAGAIFAAWPYVYAVAFSGTYFVMLLLLLTMGIARPVSAKYRTKLTNQRWRYTWDKVIFIGGFVPALMFGILVGNILTGLPFYFDELLRVNYHGTFAGLFNPFSCFCGLVSLCMLIMHGGLYLAIKTNTPIYERAVFWARIAACGLIITFALAGIWVAKYKVGYQLMSYIDTNGFSNPLHKEVVPVVGSWLHNYVQYPLTMLAPMFGFLGAIGVLCLANWSRLAFISSCLSIAGVISTVGVSMFPFILPSSTNLSSSLLVWDASSSALTLMVMLVSTVIFLPIILIYTAWVYRVFRGKVTASVVKRDAY